MTDFGTGHIVQRDDGKSLAGCGYRNGKAYPYWTDWREDVQVFKTERGAISSASRHGGHVERVALDYYGNPDIVMR